ncbi:uncharacterized protein LOC115443346 isoform X1 [Manduca sexta]|uniref:uncharacterized protein LOC115443346 isoform X1 n=2 Tax=Manduca sexta TaxID=7130 RepID=UPI00188ECD9F|nr:uncharacterized protein LOC115443346 isoform X1 [Manduca sexta]
MTMMILGVFLLSVLTIVCPQPAEVPYVTSVEAIKEFTEQLKEQILSMENNVPDITDSRIHYGVLLTHIIRVAEKMELDGPIYDNVYIDEMPKSIAIGLSEVDTVIEVTKEILEEIDQGTSKINELIERLCPSNDMPQVCNQLVQQAVIGDPVRYNEEVDLLLSAGDIAQDLLDANLVEVADRYEEIAFLIENLNRLRPLVVKVVHLLMKLDDDDV